MKSEMNKTIDEYKSKINNLDEAENNFKRTKTD